MSRRELEEHGLTYSDRVRNRHLKQGYSMEYMRHFVAAESDIYPQLAVYYAWESEWWFSKVSQVEEEEEEERVEEEGEASEEDEAA